MRLISEVIDNPKSTVNEDVLIVAPTVEDGGDVWRIARDSSTLDLNSSYAYLLYCQDFAETCRVAKVDGKIAGFVLGHRPPERPDSLFIWQIAVDEKFRGRGLAGALLDALVGDLVRTGEVSTLETTVTDDNIASRTLFASFAKRWTSTAVEKSALFGSEHFPDDHDAEPLYRIGPLDAAGPITARHQTPRAESRTHESEESEMTIFDDMESQVRSYSRSWPAVFKRAKGASVFDEDGKEYLDFFSGAGALNYGHNNPILKEALIDYLSEDGIFHSLDMYTTARRDFLNTFSDCILKPRNLDYKVIFPGPGGANAVEAALKLARKITGREQVISFTNSFHGMTLGALAVTGNSLKRGGAGIPLVHSTPMPFDDYFDGAYPDFFYFEKMLLDSGSGLNLPAAVIVETVQGEGGINAARIEWLQGLAELCKTHGILLIVDDIQMGCGRTGAFFSFEDAGIVPDMVCLSKSISGYGFPMALTLVRPELDIWEPGEHNGTFRGISPAFVTSAAAIRTYWADGELEASTRAKGLKAESRFNQIIAKHQDYEMIAKGRGLARGLQFESGEIAGQVCAEAYARGLLLESSGPEGEVMKILPALTITNEELERGLDIIEQSVDAVLAAVAQREVVSA